MNEMSWLRVLNSCPDNLTSKTCPELSRRLKNPKWGGLVAIIVTFAMCGAVAGAQQQAKVPKIGWLRSNGSGAARELIERELRELGYVDGKNIAFEHRSAEGKLDRLPALADELVRLKLTYSSRLRRLLPKLSRALPKRSPSFF